MGRGRRSKYMCNETKCNDTCIEQLTLNSVVKDKSKEESIVEMNKENPKNIQIEMLSRFKVWDLITSSKDFCTFDFAELHETWESALDTDFTLVDSTFRLMKQGNNTLAVEKRMDNVYIYMSKDCDTMQHLVSKQMAILELSKSMTFLAHTNDADFKPRQAVWIAEIGMNVIFGYADMNILDSVNKIKDKLKKKLVEGTVYLHF